MVKQQPLQQRHGKTSAKRFVASKQGRKKVGGSKVLLPSHLRPRAKAGAITMNFSGAEDKNKSNNNSSSNHGHSPAAASIALDEFLGSTPELPVQMQVARRPSTLKKQRDLNVAPFIWDPKAKSTQTVQRAYFEIGRSRFVARNTVDDELSRLRFKKRIMARLDTLCVSSLGEAVCQRLSLHTSVTIRNGNALWGRWLMHSVNPLDPSSIDAWTPANALDSLVDELRSAGAQILDAQNVAVSFTKFVTKALRQRRVSSARGGSSSGGGRVTNRHWERGPTIERAAHTPSQTLAVKDRATSEHDDTSDVNYTLDINATTDAGASTKSVAAKDKMKKNKSRVAFVFMDERAEINSEHLDKLAELYRRHQGCPRSHADLVQGLDSEFNAHVMALLLRYEREGGPGFQAALNGGTFRVLKDQFGVRHECFASPLNCNFEHYCSAFLDTDYLFGSCGSFFDFRPVRGSFEANPPFVAQVIQRMAGHIDDLLASSNEPLMFSVIVPAWTENSGKSEEVMTHSRFLRKQLRVENRSHTYREGAQHRTSRNTRKSTCNTAIFFLQNEAGVAAWPVTDNACAALLSAFEQS